MRAAPGSARHWVRQDLRQLRFQSFQQGFSVGRIQAVQNDAVNVYVDLAHTHPRISAPESGRSTF